jgi:glycosyltransferase involved in cell wall biosynthesis
MPDQPILGEPYAAAESIGKADLVIGIPSYNNARTIGQVVRAASVGLAKYFPQLTGVIINSDGGSKDGTREAVLSTTLEDAPLMLLTTPQVSTQLLSFPYHGIPGKGSAFRLIFQLAEKLEAKACAVVDSDLRSITPEWIDLLLRPILSRDFDFVAPYYHRHKYDGTITNSIVYPLTRCLYGLRVRQPIGGEFGVSAKVIARYLQRDDWETDVARFGIDIWMTTIALAEGFKVCQSFLGAKLHDAKDPGSDLSAMLQQVVSSVFLLMREYEPVWRMRTGSAPATLFGFRFDVGLEPIAVNVERMVTAFCRGCSDLGEVWKLAMQPDTYAAVAALGRDCSDPGKLFHLNDDLWARVVMDFACAWRRNPLEGGHLLRSLTPLYLARVASFVEETRSFGSVEVEERIEQLCLTFEALKPYLIAQWEPEPAPDATPPDVADPEKDSQEATVEV